MDNSELYSEIRKLDSELYRLRLSTSDRIWKIWLVMLVGFEILAFFVIGGLGAKTAAVPAQPPPQAAHVHPGTAR